MAHNKGNKTQLKDKNYIKDKIGGFIKIPKKEKEKEPIKNLDNLKPIDHGVIAYPHTPVYKMHRINSKHDTLEGRIKKDLITI